MRPQALRLLTYLPALSGLVVFIYLGCGAAVELLTNFRVLHNRNLWAPFHPGLWFWCVLLALMMVATITSWLAKRSLRSRATSIEHLT